MIANIQTISPETKIKVRDLAKEVFNSESHPDEIQPNEETLAKLSAISPDTVLYEIDNEEPRSWVVCIPTSLEIMRLFLSKEISEKDLLDKTNLEETYPALYLCAVSTIPKFQRQGLATKLVKEALLRLPLMSGYELFTWPTTEAGAGAVTKLEQELAKVIHRRV